MENVMSPFKTVALTASAVLISAVSAQAARHHAKMMHHTPAHAMHHRMTGHSAAMSRRSAPNADNSADSLNAQSLTRSQGVVQ